MSDTLLASSKRIRRLCRDNNSQRYAIGTNDLYALMDSKVQEIGGRLGLGRAWATAAVTLAAGTSDYTLPTTTSAEYAQIINLLLASQQWTLDQVSESEMADLRVGPSNSIPRGDPTHYSLIEGTTNAVTVRLFPTPWKVDTIDVLRTLVPGALTADVDVVPLSRLALRGLEKAVAADVIASLDAEELARLKLNPTIAAKYGMQADNLIQQERIRILRQKRTGYLRLVEA